ncbi:hypothetical protein [Burkholderia sp. 22PA0106]|uniref:hypothetical protein n=1 Tax=Burkholderia sp. 22PA0106 TaxID=3237371 RepID=UPI0039C3DF6C
MWPAAFWLGWLALCCLLWMGSRDSVITHLMALLGFSILAIVACVETIRAVLRRRWRVLLSVLLGPLLSAGGLVLVANRTVDLDRLHFLVVEYPHEHTLRGMPGDAMKFGSWDWGIVAPLAGPGTAYRLVFDATGRFLLQQQAKEGTSLYARPMGDGFYLVAEAEDNGDVCMQIGDLSTALRREGFGRKSINDEQRRTCELQVAASIRQAVAEGFLHASPSPAS